jgi:predicted metal-binding membrane protein
MTAELDSRLSHLTGADAIVGTVAGHPRKIAWALLIAMVALGWAYLLVLTAAAGLAGTYASLGPGMAMLDRFAAWSGLSAHLFPLLASHDWLRALTAICVSHPADWSLGDAAAHASMWLAMSLAMMLPTAAPMLRTYAEIADTAAARGKRIVSPLVLAAGYLSIWCAFALGLTLLEWLLGVSGLLSGTEAILTGTAAAVVLAGAGLYQLGSTKAACLVKCAHPFPVLFAHWTESPAGVYRLGLEQGMFCLACCWSLMLVMFAVGLMNIVWIAGLTVLMTVEKLIGARWFSRAIGAGLLLWAMIALTGLPAIGM